MLKVGRRPSPLAAFPFQPPPGSLNPHTPPIYPVFPFNLHPASRGSRPAGTCSHDLRWGGVGAVRQAALGAMRGRAAYPRTQAMAAGLMGNLMCSADQSKQPMGDSQLQSAVYHSGGAKLIVSAVKEHECNADLQRQGFHALWWLSYHVDAARWLAGTRSTQLCNPPAHFLCLSNINPRNSLYSKG